MNKIESILRASLENTNPNNKFVRERAYAKAKENIYAMASKENESNRESRIDSWLSMLNEAKYNIESEYQLNNSKIEKEKSIEIISQPMVNKSFIEKDITKPTALTLVTSYKLAITAVVLGINGLADFMKPLGEYTGAILAAGILGIVATLVAKRLFTATSLAGVFHAVFVGCAFLAVSSSAMLVGRALYPSANKTGLVAALIPGVDSLQQQFLQLEVTAGKIETNTAETAKNTAILKKETSENPQKELSNRGYQWTEESFGSALSQRDFPAIQLFLQGGMKVGSDALFAAFTSEIIENDILKKIVESKSVRSFALCEGYEDSSVNLMEANWIISHGYSRYTQTVFDLTKNKNKWGMFVDLCGEENLEKHWQSMIEKKEGKQNEYVRGILVALGGVPINVQPQLVGTSDNFVDKFTNEAMAECQKAVPDQKAEVGPGFATEANFNSDKIPDYVFDYGALSCGPSLNCGSAGCLVSIYVSGKNGYLDAWADNYQRWSIENVGDRDSLAVSGKDGSNILIWNGKKFVRKK